MSASRPLTPPPHGRVCAKTTETSKARTCLYRDLRYLYWKDIPDCASAPRKPQLQGLVCVLSARACPRQDHRNLLYMDVFASNSQKPYLQGHVCGKITVSSTERIRLRQDPRYLHCKDISDCASVPRNFILFLCLLLSLWPFQLYFIP